MVRLSNYLTAACLTFCVCLMSFSASAQQDFAGYNEESVGVIDYSDSEAAGVAPLPADSSADAVVPDEPATAPATDAAGATVGGEATMWLEYAPEDLACS